MRSRKFQTRLSVVGTKAQVTATISAGHTIKIRVVLDLLFQIRPEPEPDLERFFSGQGLPSPLKDGGGASTLLSPWSNPFPHPSFPPLYSPFFHPPLSSPPSDPPFSTHFPVPFPGALPLNPARGLGERCKLPSGVRGGAPATRNFVHLDALSWSRMLWYCGVN